MSRTNIDIDDELIHRVMVRYQLTTKREAVDYALRALAGQPMTRAEVLEFFGRPILLNELRGEIGFSPNGRVLQERYSAADLGGIRDSSSFTGATATIRCACISSDGSMRLGCIDADGGIGSAGTAYFVYQRMGPGELDAWLEERQLPLFGGTVPTLSTEELRVAYPYLEKKR